jgi:hypothetical protein
VKIIGLLVAALVVALSGCVTSSPSPQSPVDPLSATPPEPAPATVPPNESGITASIPPTPADPQAPLSPPPTDSTDLPSSPPPLSSKPSASAVPDCQPPCAAGYTASWGFDGSRSLCACIKVASDADRACTQQADCEAWCVVTKEDLYAMNCQMPKCFQLKTCEGIRGRCSSTKGAYNLPRPNEVRALCEA